MECFRKRVFCDRPIRKQVVTNNRPTPLLEAVFYFNTRGLDMKSTNSLEIFKQLKILKISCSTLKWCILTFLRKCCSINSIILLLSQSVHSTSLSLFVVLPIQEHTYLAWRSTVITKAVPLGRGPSIAHRLGWPLRLPQMWVTRTRNFC